MTDPSDMGKMSVKERGKSLGKHPDWGWVMWGCETMVSKKKKTKNF